MVSIQQPDSTTLEVSLHGCGVGESIALHIGGGDWVLVDACRTSRSELPLNLAHLYELGVDPAKAVKLFVITHWHDDHIDGAAEIVERCPAARVSFSAAMAKDEFRRLVLSFTDPDSVIDREKSGVREMGRILSILTERRQRAANYRPFLLGQADLLLQRREDCELYAISPSPRSVEKALGEISTMLKYLESDLRITLVSSERNHNSIALWLRWGQRRVLLGADLENTNDSLTGWQAALQCQRFPDGRATIFKIPHHGSPNGDHPNVWTDVVDDKSPISIVTSYSRGATPRPSTDDLLRLVARSPEIYSTTLPKAAKIVRERTVERTIAEVAKSRTPVVRAAGHVQVRWPEDAEPAVAVFGAASKVHFNAR